MKCRVLWAAGLTLLLVQSAGAFAETYQEALRKLGEQLADTLNREPELHDKDGVWVAPMQDEASKTPCEPLSRILTTALNQALTARQLAAGLRFQVQADRDPRRTRWAVTGRWAREKSDTVVLRVEYGDQRSEGYRVLGTVPAEFDQDTLSEDAQRCVLEFEMVDKPVVASSDLRVRESIGPSAARVHDFAKGEKIWVVARVKGQDWVLVDLPPAKNQDFGSTDRRGFIYGLEAASTGMENSGPGRLPQAGKTFRDCSECPEMVWIPPGEFTMGSPGSESGRQEAEGPQHQVRITYTLAVSKYEVTRGDFAAFARETGHQINGGCYTWNDENQKWELDTAKTWQGPGFSQSDRHPVVCVGWDDAIAYVRWLSAKTGRSYRLLSEAEWEYAARAGTLTARWWGDSHAEQCRHANGADRSYSKTYPKDSYVHRGCNDGFVHTAPVGSFTANRFGLYDVVGNVWEWVEDCWNSNYDGAPRDGSVWGSGDCRKRTIRGGSWANDPSNNRAAHRAEKNTGARSNNVGLRVARTN